jgi:tryptophan-rich sensory protein
MGRYAQLALFIALVAVVTFSAGQFMPGAWYQTIAKPTWTPPSWLFGPVWSMLYVMIAVAGWVAWQNHEARPARPIWVVQLLLNGLWSPVMFGLHQIGLALIVVVLMWLSIAAFIAVAWRPARTAALLFVPYLAWVSFATALNFAIWRLN